MTKWPYVIQIFKDYHKIPLILSKYQIKLWENKGVPSGMNWNVPENLASVILGLSEWKTKERPL